MHQEFRALEPHVEAISRRIAVNISEFFRNISESFRKKSENFSHFSDFLVGSVAYVLQNRDLVRLTSKGYLCLNRFIGLLSRLFIVSTMA